MVGMEGGALDGATFSRPGWVAATLPLGRRLGIGRKCDSTTGAKDALCAGGGVRAVSEADYVCSCNAVQCSARRRG